MSEFSQGLRDLADFMDNAPSDLFKRKKLTVTIHRWNECEIPKFAHALGTCEKVFNNESVGLRKRFGPVTLKIYWWRESVCKTDEK